MRFLRLFALVFILSAVGGHAWANTINQFNFSSTLTNGYTAQGLVSIDITDGQIVTSYFTLAQNGVTDATFAQTDYSQSTYGVYLAEFQDAVHDYTYELLLPNASLVGYTGGSVCTTTHTCLGYPSGVFLPNGSDAVAVSGTLSPTAPTPEPGSFLLLGSGLLAGFALSRWRTAPKS